MTNVTKLWFGVLFCTSLLTFVKTEDAARNTNDQATKCDVEECQRLRDRLETLEEAVKTIVSALASQKNRLFTPINAILERNSVLRSIVLPPSSHVRQQNSALQSKEEIKNSTNKQPENNATSQLKGAIKCSLTQLLDINFSENSANNSSGKINAALGVNNSLEIEWTPYSNECLKSCSGVWIRVFEPGKKQLGSDSYLDIPQKCLKKKSSASFSTVFPHSSSQKVDRKTCHFELNVDLIQCRSYTVEVVPNYQSLKGTPIFTEIVIPPAGANVTDLNLLTNVVSRYHSLELGWKDNSGCAPQLTSLGLRISPEVKDTTETQASNNSFIKIPRSCLKKLADVTNDTFSVVLSPVNGKLACPTVEWEPLQECRIYTIEVKSEYSEVWTGAPSLWEVYTAQIDLTKMECPLGQLPCRHLPSRYYDYEEGRCIPASRFCDGSPDCENGADEQNCKPEYFQYFHCGGRCINYDFVCDGKIDCFDGSDEKDICDNYGLTCNRVTAKHGHFSLRQSPRSSNSVTPLGHRPTFSLSKTVLISVQANHTIWLDLKKIFGDLRVYDGSYSTSRLLWSHSSPDSPRSVRSSNSDLYIEFPVLNRNSLKHYEIEIFYTSVHNTHEQFVPECGGYIYGYGVVSLPNYSNVSGTMTNCIWFVEADDNKTAILLKKSFTIIPTPRRTAPFGTNDYDSDYTHSYDDNEQEPTKEPPIYDNLSANSEITVYDGWSSSGQVFYDGRLPSPHARTIFYSMNKKIMIQFRPPDEVGRISNINYYLNFYSVSSPTKCEEELGGDTGTIKSPNYPEEAYPNSVDCRWKIVTALDSKIRLLFALFETQENFDYVYVYDGPTMNSPLLLEKSGSTLKPFAIDSSSNEMFIRFRGDRGTLVYGVRCSI